METREHGMMWFMHRIITRVLAVQSFANQFLSVGNCVDAWTNIAVNVVHLS